MSCDAARKRDARRSETLRGCSDAALRPRVRQRARSTLLLPCRGGQLPLLADGVPSVYEHYRALLRVDVEGGGAAFLHPSRPPAAVRGRTCRGQSSAMTTAPTTRMVGRAPQAREELRAPRPQSTSPIAASAHGSEGTTAILEDGWDALVARWQIHDPLTIRYGKRSMVVSRRWYSGYMNDSSRWSSAESTLATLLPEFHGATKNVASKADSIIGCFNIPAEPSFALEDGLPSSYLFWSDGEGAPRHCFRLICKMLAAYSELIEDPCSHRCDGLGEFTRRLVCGWPASRKNTADHEVDRCTLTVHLISRDERYGGVLEPQYGCVDGPAIPCGVGYYPFDDDEGFPRPVGDLRVYEWDSGTGVVVLSAEPEGIHDPNSGVDFKGIGQDFSIFLPAINLAFDAYRCDYTMFLARLALDFAQENAAALSVDQHAAYLMEGRRLAQHAVAILADWGRLFIHELGHTYLGPGHCSPWGNCFERAAQRWLCKVKGELGLSMYSDDHYPIDEALYTNEQFPGVYGDTYAVDMAFHPTVGVREQGFSYACCAEEHGEVGGGASFAATLCESPPVSWTALPCEDGSCGG